MESLTIERIQSESSRKGDYRVRRREVFLSSCRVARSPVLLAERMWLIQTLAVASSVQIVQLVCHSDPYASLRARDRGTSLEFYRFLFVPAGFDRRFISIHMETYYWRNKNVPKPASGQPQFILANGDTTGYGLHADL